MQMDPFVKCRMQPTTICRKVSAIISAWIRTQFVCCSNIANEPILRRWKREREKEQFSNGSPRWGTSASWGSFLSWGNGRACSVRRNLGEIQGKLCVEVVSMEGLRGKIAVIRWWVLGWGVFKGVLAWGKKSPWERKRSSPENGREKTNATQKKKHFGG